MKERIINAEGAILGRLSSVVAKMLLNGENIVIVNAEKAIVSGSREAILEKYLRAKMRGSREKGPYFPRMPDRILRRTIRGMLPYKQEKGRSAMRRLKVFIGIPDEYRGREMEELRDVKVMRKNYLTLAEISRHLGYKI